VAATAAATVPTTPIQAGTSTANGVWSRS
jgi:hypothetical protein